MQVPWVSQPLLSLLSACSLFHQMRTVLPAYSVSRASGGSSEYISDLDSVERRQASTASQVLGNFAPTRLPNRISFSLVWLFPKGKTSLVPTHPRAYCSMSQFDLSYKVSQSISALWPFQILSAGKDLSCLPPTAKSPGTFTGHTARSPCERVMSCSSFPPCLCTQPDYISLTPCRHLWPWLSSRG